MTDPTLPPEVAEAIKRADAAFRHTGFFDEPAWSAISTHLHHLAEENARLLSIQIGMHRDVCANALRAEEAEARVQELERENGELRNDLDTTSMECDIPEDACDAAEAELAALKARIAEAPVITGDGCGLEVIAPGWEGMRVALLKLEDGE